MRPRFASLPSAQVDARFHGCISTVKPVMTAETAKKLGKRLSTSPHSNNEDEFRFRV